MLKRKTMKSLLLLPFIICCFTASAKNYYISNSGNDGNSGTSPTDPWKTISKLNSFTGFVAGDAVLFNRGDIFYGQLAISKSGTSSNPIVFGAYGSGAKPVISGFTTISSWTNLGGNIWESTNAVSNLSTTNMVAVNGVNTQMGKYPNSGYLTYKSHVAKTSITDPVGLTGSPNWTGAELAMFVTTYVIERNLITSQSGSTLSYISSSGNNVQRDGLRYIIQNDPRTLDSANEWYFNPSTKKLRIYSTGSPANVQMSTIDTLIKIVGLGSLSPTNYITFDNISFQGSNKISIEISNSRNISVQNCDFNFSGGDGIHGPYNGNSTALTISQCTFNQTNNNAINVAGDFDNALITNNTIKNTGILPGMCKSGDNNSMAICATGPSSTIQYNNIDSSGYVGIRFDGNYTTVQNNFVNNSLLVKVDGGAIYTWNGSGAGRTVFVGRKVINNIVLNTLTGSGIYMDDGSQGVEVAGNSVANCRYGIYIHGNQNMNVHDNTVYNCSTTQLLLVAETNDEAIRNVTLKNNIFFSKDASQLTLLFGSPYNDIPLFGTASNNYYARPIDDNLTFACNPVVNGSRVYTTYNLAGWKTYSGQDANSLKSPKTITTTNDLTFVYNAGSSNLSIGLNANYIDVKGKAYNGIISLAPYTSAVLIKNGATTYQPPTANAGTAQTITLPINSLNLSGSGTSATGTISAYNWTKIAGPASGTIISPTSAATSVTVLVQGVYNFELKVTDNIGGIGRDTIQITVNPANIPSTTTANAGTAQTITLPVNTVNLSGSGTSSTGSISGYDWTKITGPTSGTITNPTSAATSVTGLVQGVYKFELKVTDNKGGVAKDTMQVTVNNNANGTNTTANAGPDQTIMLPTNSVNLSGSGTGTITAYQWRQLSGPTMVISSRDYADATVTGLVLGIYQFELKVTDSKNSTKRDTMQVTLNSGNKPVINTTANAGPDQTITLPTNSVNLSGSGTGTITAYQWRQLSGSSIVISNRDYAAATVTGLVQGIYQFELKVTDSRNSTKRDTMKLIVNPALNFATKTTPLVSGTSADSTKLIAVTSAVNRDSIQGMANTVTNNAANIVPQSKIYPNPVQDITTLEMNVTTPNSNLLILINDMKGTTVYKKEINSGVGIISEKINMTNFAQGIYAITIVLNNKEKQTLKVMKL